MTRRRDERGAATVLTVSLLGVLLWLGAALGVVAALVHSHRTAQAAADLAALAAAQALARGGDACAAGRAIAGANGAVHTECRLEGRDAWVTVRVTGPRWLGVAADPSAQARAGLASRGVAPGPAVPELPSPPPHR